MDDITILDPRIRKFLRKHHVLTLATCSDGQPWVAHAFYAVGEGDELIFSSNDQTRHIMEGLANSRVAVSVVLESRVVGRLQGVQITGELVASNESLNKLYLKRFPYAVVALQDMWTVKIDTAKFTDNTLGFGKKLYCDKNK